MAKKKNKTVASREDALFNEHLELATKVANSIAKKLPRSIDRDDLIQAGLIGLMDAVKRFNASRGVKFITFAVWRVRGEIMDWLRKQDAIPRSVRIRQSTRRKAEQSIIEQDGVATADAVKDQLQWSDGEYRMSLPRHTHQMSSLATEGESRTSTFDAPSLSADEVQLLKRLDGVKGLVRHLSIDTFVLFYLYYWRGMTMRHIGEVLGVSESRISQMRTQGLEVLRTVGAKLRDHF